MRYVCQRGTGGAKAIDVTQAITGADASANADKSVHN